MGCGTGLYPFFNTTLSSYTQDFPPKTSVATKRSSSYYGTSPSSPFPKRRNMGLDSNSGDITFVGANTWENTFQVTTKATIPAYLKDDLDPSPIIGAAKGIDDESCFQNKQFAPLNSVLEQANNTASIPLGRNSDLNMLTTFCQTYSFQTFGNDGVPILDPLNLLNDLEMASHVYNHGYNVSARGGSDVDSLGMISTPSNTSKEEVFSGLSSMTPLETEFEMSEDDLNTLTPFTENMSDRPDRDAISDMEFQRKENQMTCLAKASWSKEVCGIADMSSVSKCSTGDLTAIENRFNFERTYEGFDGSVFGPLDPGIIFMDPMNNCRENPYFLCVPRELDTILWDPKPEHLFRESVSQTFQTEKSENISTCLTEPQRYISLDWASNSEDSNSQNVSTLSELSKTPAPTTNTHSSREVSDVASSLQDVQNYHSDTPLYELPSERHSTTDFEDIESIFPSDTSCETDKYFLEMESSHLKTVWGFKNGHIAHQKHEFVCKKGDTLQGNDDFVCDTREPRQQKCVSSTEINELTPSSTPKRPNATSSENTPRQTPAKTKHKCMTCPKTFQFPSLLKSHEASHTNDKPHKCGICGKGFSKAYGLDRHQEVHSDEKPYPCAECKSRFKRKSSLKQHTQKHTGERPYQCTDCDHKSAQKGNLIAHMSIHKR